MNHRIQIHKIINGNDNTIVANFNFPNCAVLDTLVPMDDNDQPQTNGEWRYELDQLKTSLRGPAKWDFMVYLCKIYLWKLGDANRRFPQIGESWIAVHTWS